MVNISNAETGSERKAAGSIGFLIGRAIRSVVPAVIGFILARTQVFGAIYPFQTALVSAMPQGSILSAAIGSAAGGFFGGGDALRLAATVFAAAGMRWALAELKRINSAAIFPTVIAVSSTLLTGLAVAGTAEGVFGTAALTYICEALLSGAAAFFFADAADALAGSDLRTIPALEPGKLTSCAMAACILAVPLCRITIGGFSPAAAVILAAEGAAARRYGAADSSVAGVAAGTVIALAAGNIGLAGVCAVAGLAAALFAPLGAVWGAVALGTTCILGSIACGSVDVFFIAEASAAAVVSGVLPEAWLERIMPCIYNEKERGKRLPGMDVVHKRLNRAADGLSAMSQTVLEVSARLDRLDAERSNRVCRQAARRVCESCAISSHCWGECRSRTVSSFDSIAKQLGEGNVCVSDELSSKCPKWGELTAEMGRLYSNRTAKDRAGRRISQVRSVMAGQMGSVAELLRELADCVEGGEQPSAAVSGCITDTLTECGYDIDDIDIMQREDGRLSVRVAQHGGEPLSGEELAEELGEMLGCSMKCESGADGWLLITRRPPMKLSFGARQRPRNSEELCGDSYNAFTVEDGECAAIVLSDGMGSGGRAAVDAAMTCGLIGQLLEAGFGVQGAMRMVNSALMVRSEDEALATADCVKIDLFSGEAQFCKAGAAVSYVRHGGEVRRIERESLPLGIMREVDCAAAELRLAAGDVVVMISDGVIGEEDDRWVSERLGSFDLTRGDMRELAAAIIGGASGDDDLTVIAARLECA